MKTETARFCECDEPIIDEKVNSYVFELCKECGGAIKRKKHICAYYLSCGYCNLAEQNNYTVACVTYGDFTKCKSGVAEAEKVVLDEEEKSE